MFTSQGYEVFFQHSQKVEDLRTEQPQPPFKGVTLCTLVNEDDDIPVRAVVAFCSVKDNFDRSKGRKVALTKMLNAAGFDKEQRTTFWHDYFAALKAV